MPEKSQINEYSDKMPRSGLVTYLDRFCTKKSLRVKLWIGAMVKGDASLIHGNAWLS